MRSERDGRMVADMANDTLTTVDPSERSTTWGRVFARVYDPSVWIGGRAGLRALRGELRGGPRGCTGEIGSGAGLILARAPDDLVELVLLGPAAAMRSRLEKRLRPSSSRARIV